MNTPYNRYKRFEITNEFWDWIKPLLYYPEDKILLNHIEMTSRGFRLIDYSQIKLKYDLSHSQLREIRRKLEGLAQMYELEVMAFS
jgi:hypothetical protein